MPTENRCNTEMPAKLSPCPFCGQQDAFVEQLDRDASVVICQGRIDEHSACLARGPVGVQQHECEDQPGHDQALEEWNKRAAAVPHPNPIAWMVGTAFWWTKEEAERDAAATGLPIVGLGPMAMAAHAEQHQSEPVALPARLPLDSEFSTYGLGKIHGWNDYHAAAAKLGPLYTHADPAEVERLRIERGRMDQALVACANERDELRKANTEFDAQVTNDFKFIDDLRAQLAEAKALLGEADEFMYIMTAHDGHAKLAHRYGKDWRDAIDKLRGVVCTALSASTEPQVKS